MIRKTIIQTVKEELEKIKREMEHKWITKLEEVISSAIQKEVQRMLNRTPIPTIDSGAVRKTYSGAVKNESVFIVRPKDDGDKSSDKKGNIK